MPYLNWKEQTQFKQEIAPLGAKQLLTLSLGRQSLDGLLPFLREVFSTDCLGELRLDLPRGWIVFWKKRDGESRLLVAHPQQDEWVATVALTAAHAAVLLDRLESLDAGQSVRLGDLAATGSVSNLELALVHH